MYSNIALEAVLKRDRMIVLGGLAGITVLAWAYMGYLTWDMGCMDMTMPRMQTWGLLDLVLLGVMWAVMMVAMMVPSAAPLLLLFTTINRRRHTPQQPYVPTAVFLGGYLLVWTGFSVLAMLAQWGLPSAALLSSMMVSTSSILGGLLLLTAGGFQWTPLKSTCLTRCRSPLGFLSVAGRSRCNNCLPSFTEEVVHFHCRAAGNADSRPLPKDSHQDQRNSPHSRPSQSLKQV